MARPRLQVVRKHVPLGTDPFATLAWEKRDARIVGSQGQVVFSQQGIETPARWSQLAVNVVASKYFRGHMDSPSREHSVKQLIGRVVSSLRAWGLAAGTFASDACAHAFADELCFLLVHQMAAFNSPVWFNVGIEARPQCSACFINTVGDSLDAIMDLAKTEAMLFKFGSGSGTNLSVLRASHERLAGGGTASGPVTFMRGFDAFAGAIKSGGTTRRAAKMVILDADHPDIEAFIWCKAKEERKAWALLDAGYSGGVDGEAYASVFYQNANHSVRVSDAFMEAVQANRSWQLKQRGDGQVSSTVPARVLLQQTAAAAHLCGDPGMQFDTAINRWHTCPADGPITASNPCSEYMFLGDTACNLASLNLRKFQNDDGELDVPRFEHAVDIMLLAQELIVDNAGYPTPKIAHNSQTFRPLGLGYANLGAFLLARGEAYDSDAGRHYAAALTALMCGRAYAQSARLAEVHGAFAGFANNAAPMRQVIAKHRDAARTLQGPAHVVHAAQSAWDEAVTLGAAHGYRNAQVTVLAPTGTIAFMMDCDTTGIEPDLALVKHKSLSGGGVLALVNATVPEALNRLGYTPEERDAIVAHLGAKGTLFGAPHLRDAHLPVFDCALAAPGSNRWVSPSGHLQMMAAVQPFLSGAISKTVNLPKEASVDDVQNVFIQAWRLGLKAVAVYRDGCKRVQPLSSGQAPGSSDAQDPGVAKCPACGAPQIRTGLCARCENCGSSSGCA